MTSAIIVLLTAILAVGCGSASTSSPAPMPTPSPAPTPATHESPSLVGLGVLPPYYETAGTALSRDGSTVVGYGLSNSRIGTYIVGFRWTRDTGMVRITPNVMGTRAYGGGSAAAISADGSVVVGSFVLRVDQTINWLRTAFRWTQDGGYSVYQLLGSRLPALWTASALTADGNVIVGRALTEASGRFDPYRFSEAVGFEVLPSPEGYGCEPFGISDDASITVGCCEDLTGVEGSRAVLWNGSAAPTTLPPPSGYRSCCARALSADGSTTAGSCDGPQGFEAVLWRDGAPEVFDRLPVEISSSASSLSADGRTVGGSIVTEDRIVAFVWTRDTGKRVLRDILAEAGLIEDLHYWYSLEDATGVSADGHTIAGTGRVRGYFGTEAFRAVIP